MAPGRHQALYSIKNFAKPCVFIKQSLFTYCMIPFLQYLSLFYYKKDNFFSRGYLINLPSSLIMVDSNTLFIKTNTPLLAWYDFLKELFLDI